MNYCCDEFQDTTNDIMGGGPLEHGKLGWSGMTDKNKWYIIYEIDMDCGSAKYKPIDYCPFCGTKLKDLGVEE